MYAAKTPIEWLLAFIAIILFLCWINLSQINARLKARFPTAKEEDFQWSQRDPMGHWEAHKDEYEKKKK